MDHSTTGARPDQIMNNALLIRCALCFLWIAPCISFAQAQQPERLVLQLEGLTSEHRDAMTRTLSTAGEARIVFACVPAGIVVLEGMDGTSRTRLEQRGRELATERSLVLRRIEQAATIAQAEAACAQVRDR